MYRTEPLRHKRPDSRINDRATETIITIDNGVTSRIAFPCYYLYRDDGIPTLPPDVWDHIGWPSPRCRDRSFQPIRVSVSIDPIDLESEGYDTVEFVMSDPPDGLTATGLIDDNVIRIMLTVDCDDVTTEETEVPFSLFVSGTLTNGSTSYPASDLVTKGIIRILPSTI